MTELKDRVRFLSGDAFTDKAEDLDYKLLFECVTFSSGTPPQFPDLLSAWEERARRKKEYVMEILVSLFGNITSSYSPLSIILEFTNRPQTVYTQTVIATDACWQYNWKGSRVSFLLLETAARGYSSFWEDPSSAWQLNIMDEVMQLLVLGMIIGHGGGPPNVCTEQSLRMLINTTWVDTSFTPMGIKKPGFWDRDIIGPQPLHQIEVMRSHRGQDYVFEITEARLHRTLQIMQQKGYIHRIQI